SFEMGNPAERWSCPACHSRSPTTRTDSVSTEPPAALTCALPRRLRIAIFAVAITTFRLDMPGGCAGSRRRSDRMRRSSGLEHFGALDRRGQAFASWTVDAFGVRSDRSY